eukprot:CAMPEP_0202818052 /NCGR_PEP_ID=MMETSP1389-20130828/8047_1 /ASSEMBLY_ACC=CAM_ASM_000865 /TAXON_ID=302021 /ORGANISM="Rhodomonas sp., Strain CCMP768" /LENGTH=551 /DNA_ID=CAMNT_0049490343 /DNA_START=322 /DNA_END=1977 /DNA_ORIENTATION=-
MVQNPPKPAKDVPLETNEEAASIQALCDMETADGIWYLEQILTAKVYDVCEETPLTEMPRLSERMGNRILAKREDMQPVFSFKIRGAYNMISHLPPEQLAKGIITASAGNHAQGVAMSAKKLGCKAIIAMPTVTPAIKINSVKRLGAEVVLVGEQFDDTKAYAQERSKRENMPFIPPFDHPLVIAGQGTIGMEILRQCTQKIHAIFIPVGGGGLIAGLASYVKRLRPDVKIIGVEPAGANALYLSLKEGKRVTLDNVDTFADGVAVRMVGEETFRLCQGLVDEVVLVDTDEICVAIKDVFEDTRSITEPSGALAVAGAKKYLAERGLEGENVVAITSGANMNFDKLRLVASRSGSGEREEAMLVSTIPEARGEFKKFMNILSEVGHIKRGTGRGDDRAITEFKYRYNHRMDAESGDAVVFYSVDTANREDADSLVSELNTAGLSTVDLSKNELAKTHVRFLAGGGGTLEDERVFRVQFPEKPGSLRRFLDVVGGKYNMSLFHYRFTGEMTGNVLVGVRPLKADQVSEFMSDMGTLGWFFEDVTDDPACQLI